jgi:hypothetical protein
MLKKYFSAALAVKFFKLVNADDSAEQFPTDFRAGSSPW